MLAPRFSMFSPNSLIAASIALLATAIATIAQARAPSPDIPSSPPPLPGPDGLAPLEVRIANAKSVRIQTSVLGLTIGSDLDKAHACLDKLCDKARSPKEEQESGEEEGERKVLWQLAKTDYSAVFVKADSQERITYIVALVRPGKAMPFAKIGEVKKAPIQNDSLIAWDVLRPDCPHIRVVAKGPGRHQANTLIMFVVQRPRTTR